MNVLRKRRWLLTALLLLLLFFLFGWLVWPDRNLATAKALQRQLFSENAKSLTSEQRREKWQALREAQKRLSPAQRRELSGEMGKRRQAEMTKYFRMSPVDKTRYLDQQIRRTEQMRRQRAQAAAGARGGSSGSSTTARQRTARGSTPGTANGSSTNVPARTTANRDARRRDRLDSTTPAERAQTAQFFRDLKNRRAQLGLPATRGFGPPR